MKVPPAELLLQVSNDPSPDNYRKVAAGLWTVEEPLKLAGYRLRDFNRILDFGCGVGRLLQALHLRRRDGQEFWGCDVNQACATWCEDNLDFASVAHTAVDSPLPYADDSFDFITAISVFTHLSRPRQVAASRELIRVLRPGGVAFVTTWGLGILPDVLAINDAWTVREFALLGATGNFYHFATGVASALEGQREVVALHAHDAIVQIFSPLQLVLHADITPAAAGQDVSVLLKPKEGCRVLPPREGEHAGPEGIKAEIAADGRASNVVTLGFRPGPATAGRFKSYIAMSARRFDLIHMAVECRLKDAASGQTLAEGRFAFPSSVTLGPDHYVPFALDCPAAQSVDVELALTLRRTPWQPKAISFRWWDFRIEVSRGESPGGSSVQSPDATMRTPHEMVRLNESLVALHSN